MLNVLIPATSSVLLTDIEPALAGGLSVSAQDWACSGASAFAVVLSSLLTALLFIKLPGGGKSGKGGAKRRQSSSFLGSLKKPGTDFEATDICKTATELFVAVHAAWRKRDLGRVKSRLDEELFRKLTVELDKAVERGRVNFFEDISVNDAVITGEWQNEGFDFITVRLAVSAVVGATDAAGRSIAVDAEPVSFSENWTFVHEIGPGRWKLALMAPE